MSELFDSETGWLNITNIALGLAVLVCLLALGRMVIQDLRKHAAARAQSGGRQNLHPFTLSSLGITMADGGEPIDENSIRNRNKPFQDEDPPNIVRSDN
ncbi:MAG TPA: hypothetical protein VMM37_08415 [Bacteroidota bacterium]|nr:hypothetical protein [Bacteroidota bacterium]